MVVAAPILGRGGRHKTRFVISQPRCRRDPSGRIDAMFSKGVEEAIRDAIERGEFDQLPGAGKPIDLDAYFETPEELRLAHSMLRNAGLVPTEVDLLQQMSAFLDRDLPPEVAERRSAVKRIRDLQLKLSVVADGPEHKRDG